LAVLAEPVALHLTLMRIGTNFILIFATEAVEVMTDGFVNQEAVGGRLAMVIKITAG
jgi:hypothetical protein